jgi:preprotein translocase subunit SecF
MGLDFTGGYEIEINYTQKSSLNDISRCLKTAGFSNAQLTTFGLNNNYAVIKLSVQNIIKGTSEESLQQILKKRVGKVFGNRALIVSLNYIGPQVGRDLVTNGFLAFIVTMIGIICYVGFRFEIKLALSAAIALIHDPIIILGIFSAFQLEFSLITLAAMLAVMGFSLNDTIVIYDRIRENFYRMKRGSVLEVINCSINDTLSRTTITSGLTLLVVLVLFLFGGAPLHTFSLALILGVIIGTYSSIYVAGLLALIFGIRSNSGSPLTRKNNHST